MDLRPLVGKQRESARLATARGNLWEGAVRSSKTISSIMVWLRYVRTGPPGNLLMVGKTERTLKRNIIDPITEMVGARRCRYRAGAGELDLFGRRIYTAGANDERAADKIKGMTLAGAYCDEVTTYPQSFFAMLGTRLSVEGSQWFGTTNPAAPTHWLKRDYLDRAKLHLQRDGTVVEHHEGGRLDLHRFTFQLDDNPTLSPAYVAALKAEYVGLFYRRYVLGEWVLAEGAVYDMWDPARHVVTWDQVPIIHRWLSVGVDYGTVNPFDAILFGIGVDHAIYGISEYRHDSRRARRQLTDPELSMEMRTWLTRVRYPRSQLRGVKPEVVCVDPSAASFKTQLFRDGLPAMNANNDVLNGIRTVSALLAADKLKIVGSDCPWLVDEIPGYAWDDRAAEKGEDAVLKVNDHSCDGGRYGLHSTRSRWRGEVLPALSDSLAA
jgi:PBSX family phage terminase large subunit